MTLASREIIIEHFFIYSLENGEMTFNTTVDGETFEPEQEAYAEAKIVFQALLKEPPLEGRLFSKGAFVSASPEDFIENDCKEFLLSFWIYNNEKRLVVPYKFWKRTQTYYNQFKDIFPEEEYSAFNFYNTMSIKDYCTSNDELTLTMVRRLEVIPYMRGGVCVSIPLPDKNPNKPKTEVVIQGDSLQENMLCITTNLDLKLKTLFICAPPGSGKETYSQLVHYGTGKSGKLKKIDMTTPKSDIERLLKGSMSEKGTFIPGILAEAKDGTIIFDEIDKLELKAKENRDLSYMLRPLDPGTYYPIGSQSELEVKDVSMIFMGAQGPEELLTNQKIIPQDFFTRVLDPKVKLEHPLPDKLGIKFDHTFTCFTRFFYWKTVEEIALIDTGLKDEIEDGRINKLLISCILNKLEDEKPCTAEMRFLALLEKWLGSYKNTSENQPDRFNRVKSLRYHISWKSIYRRSDLKLPSIRELARTVNGFIKRNWNRDNYTSGHLLIPENDETEEPNAEVVQALGNDLQKLISRNSQQVIISWINKRK